MFGEPDTLSAASVPGFLSLIATQMCKLQEDGSIFPLDLRCDPWDGYIEGGGYPLYISLDISPQLVAVSTGEI